MEAVLLATIPPASGALGLGHTCTDAHVANYPAMPALLSLRPLIPPSRASKKGLDSTPRARQPEVMVILYVSARKRDRPIVNHRHEIIVITLRYTVQTRLNLV